MRGVSTRAHDLLTARGETSAQNAASFGRNFSFKSSQWFCIFFRPSLFTVRSSFELRTRIDDIHLKIFVRFISGKKLFISTVEVDGVILSYSKIAVKLSNVLVVLSVRFSIDLSICFACSFWLCCFIYVLTKKKRKER